MFLFMILMLQFTVTEQLSSSVAVRAGDDVTLTCEHVKDDKCLNTQWIYNDPDHTRTDALVRGGQTERSTSDRLSVGEKCSLVIEKVTGQDAGLYSCRQDGDSEIHLSVVTLTESKLQHQVGFYCHVSTHKLCKPSVKWLHQGQSVYGDYKDLKAPGKHTYYAVVTFEDSQVINSSVLTSLTCEVIDCRTNVHQFPFRPQASDKDGKPATTGSTTATTESTTVTIESTTATTVRISSTSDSSVNGELKGWWWWLIAGAVSVAAVVIVVIAVKRCQRGNGRNTHVDEKADPEEGVSYASISFRKKSSSEAKVKGQADDGGEAVTYSCVKAADAGSLYATISK